MVRVMEGELPGSATSDTWIGMVDPGVTVTVLAETFKWNGAACWTITLAFPEWFTVPLVPTTVIPVVATTAEADADSEKTTPPFVDPALKVVGPFAVAVTPAGNPCSEIVISPLKP